jgi:hypothetical protein
MKNLITLISCILAANLFAVNSFALPIVGSSSGIFTSVVPNSSSSVYSGLGTNTLTTGDASYWTVGPNQWSFTGQTFNTSTETSFLLGTLMYYNGTTAVGTDINGFDLQTTLNFTNPALGNKSFTFPFVVNMTVNSGDQNADADILTLPSVFPAQTFIIDNVAYTVKLNGFSNALVSGGFISPDGLNFHVFEGGYATADLYGIVTSDIPSSVPEPSTIFLIGAGLAGLALYRRKNYK